MAPGTAAKRVDGAPKQQQQQKKKQKAKPKPKQGGRGGGERVVLRWEAVEEDVIEVTAAPMVPGGKAASVNPKKKKKQAKKGKEAEDDTFDDDALVGISDDEEEDDDEEYGTFGGSKFVMLDVEDDLEQLVLEASALSIGGGHKGSSPHPTQAEKSSKPKSKKKKKDKKSKEDLTPQDALAVDNASNLGRPKSAAEKADGRAGGSKSNSADRSTGKQNAEAVENKASTVDASSKKKPKKKGKNPPNTAPNDTRVGEKVKKPSDRETPKPDSTPGEKSRREQRSRGRTEEGGRTNGDVDSKTVYTDYLARDVVTRGLEDGSLLQGKLRVNAMYRMDGYVTVDGIPVDILVKGMADRNRGVDGDLVAIKLYPEEEWKTLGDARDDVKAIASVQTTPQGPPPKPEIDANALHSLWRPNVDSSKCIIRSAEGTEDKGSDVNSKLKEEVAKINERARENRSRPTATVVFVLAAGNSGGFIGCLEPRNKMTDVNAPLPSEDAYAYFNAHDQRLPRRIQIPRLQLPDEFIRLPVVYSKTMLCFCRIKTWSTQYRSPKGEFVKTVGEYTGIDTGISAILSKNDLQAHTLDFSSAILEELDVKYGTSGEKWDIPDEEAHKRRDFRDNQIFSIDPYNARDLDDALHIRALDDARTTFEIGVHIADVTHFVERNSLLDKEAQSRATSVYLPNRVLPMLPRILCEKLCSLQPQVDRLAFSVVWQMNIDGTLVEGSEPWFGKSMIRSCCKLDYGSAQKMLDGTISSDKLDEWEVDRRPIPGANPAITNASVIQSVKDLWAIGENRRAMRFDTGAISLNDIKLVFTLDQKGNPTRFGSYQIKDSNRLVEEYMLLANFLVAQKLLQAHGPLAFIRHHPAPVERAMGLALERLKEHSLEIDASATKRLSDSLDRVRREHGDTVFAIVQAMLIKPMKPAEYMVAGNGASPEVWRHYALNIPYYTHFTSPIRRYADVVVHRLLQESVTSDPLTSDNVSVRLLEFTSIAQNCNDKKMAAKAAEKECDEVFLCAYIKHLGSVDVTGVVMSSGQQSFTVYIMELGVERRLFLKDLHITGAWDDKAKELTIQLPTAKNKAKKNKQRRRKQNNGEQEDENEEEKEKKEEDTFSSPASPVIDASAEDVEEALSFAPQRLRLAFMTQLKLKMSATTKMPLALTFALVGADRL
jgi:DIS3-like exonuclease 2